MSAYNQEMFAKISEAMKGNTNNNQANYSNILRLKSGNTYTVRLLPNIKEPSKTLFHYYSHGWNSLATGQYISAVSPSTWGERDPIDEAKFKLAKHGTEQEKEDSKLLTRRENWLINVYVVNDPTDSENNGQIKILRFGKQLHKIINSAIEGEDADEFGFRVFELSPDGCNLKIKVEEQGGYSTYVSSRFASPTKIPGLVNDESYNEVYKGIYDLESVFPVKSYDELKDMLNDHFFCKEPDSDNNQEYSNDYTPSNSSITTNSNDDDDDDDDLDYGGTEDEKVKNLLSSLSNE